MRSVEAIQVLNIHSYIVIFTVLTVRLPPSLTCNIRDAANCPYIDLTSEDVWDFIAKEDLEPKCRKLQAALSCALKPEITTGCSSDETIVFKTVQAFTTAICDTHRYAYLQGVDCFMQEEVKDAAQTCKRSFKRMSRIEPCMANAVTDTRMCFREEMTASGCTAEDNNLIAYLADVYLLPYNTKYGCGWDSSITVGPLAMPSTTAADTTTPVTTPALTTVVSTLGPDNSTQSEHTGKVKDASSRLTGTSSVLIGSLLALLVLGHVRARL